MTSKKIALFILAS